MPPLAMTRMRLERLEDERKRTSEKIEDILGIAEDEKRLLNEVEEAQLEKHRSHVADLEAEIVQLAGDLERDEKSRDYSALLRPPEPRQNGGGGGGDGPIVYGTFARYARDWLLVRYPTLAAQAANSRQDASTIVEQASERLERASQRALQHTLTTDVPGLLPPQHMAQIMDIINKSRPVVQSGRQLPLESGKITYPRITRRPDVAKQTTEKTEGGTVGMQVALDQLIADTYLGGGNLSWQTINWSTPDALQLWFDLAAEDYALETEKAACSELGTAGGGTISTALGTTGTETFAQWRNAVLAGLKTIYNNTGGRARSDTLWLSADRFFALAGLGTDQTLQVSAVGALDISSMTGTWGGLRVVGSYGFGTGSSQAIVGDASAFLVAESRDAPVEMRAVEPAIGGMEVGVIGGFKSKVYDSTRFIHLS